MTCGGQALRSVFLIQVIFSVMFLVDYMALGFINLGVTRIDLVGIYVVACLESLLWGKIIAWGRNKYAQRKA